MTRPIVLVWPPSALSGHNKGGWYKTRKLVKAHRAWAHAATLEVRASVPPIPPRVDIPIHIRFVPPDNRSDRTNYANRIKPGLDGIADALAINDRFFLPSYEYAEPDRENPRVEVWVGGRP